MTNENENVSKQKENIDKNKKNVLKNPYQTTNDSLLSPDFAYIGDPAGDLLASCSENNI